MICENLRSCCMDMNYPCDDKSSCLLYKDTRKNAACGEKGKRYNLINNLHHTIAVYRMDGGIIRNEPGMCKCDYLYYVGDISNPTAIFIELKGKDIVHALEQIRNSIDKYKTCFTHARIYARIICTRVPRMYNDPSILKYKKEMRKNYSGNLVIAEHNFDEDYLDMQ